MSNETIDLFKLAGFFPKQIEATVQASQHKYFLYGGSRGPGKSYWLRWYSLGYLLYWFGRGLRNVRVGLFCEDYPALTDRHITKIKTEFPDWLGELRSTQTDGLGFHLYEKWGGGILALRNLDDPKKYKSSEFALAAVDELTQNRSIKVFDTLRGSLRWPGIKVAKLVAASNPDGPGRDWVRRLWIEKQMPPELMGHEGEFCYLPALPDDNPHLSQDYWNTLNTLPDLLRRAWRYGDWYVSVEGAVFNTFSHDVHVKPREYSEMQYFCLAIDEGYTNPASILLIGFDYDLRWHIFREFYQTGVLPSDMVQMVKAFCTERPIAAVAVDNAAAGLIADLINEGLPAHGAKGRILDRVAFIQDLLKVQGDKRPRLTIDPSCVNTINEFESYVWQENKEMPVDADNHSISGIGYLASWLFLEEVQMSRVVYNQYKIGPDY